MREIVIKRMKQEIDAYREYLVSGRVTASEIVEQAYQLVVKQGLFYVFASHNTEKVSEDIWECLCRQEHIINYLFEVWMSIDVDLSDEFAEIILNELKRSMEVHKDE